MVHQHAKVAQLTPRQLKDVVEDLQMHWLRYLDENTDIDMLTDLVDALITRFGSFCLRSFTYDDINMRDPASEDRMSILTIRRMVSIFCLLYRHLHMVVSAEYVEKDDPVCANADIPVLEDFHVQASQEAFYKHCMHADIPPAARLLYQQDFAGFYHCVSQVVYFHYPSYERRIQLPLDRVRTGTDTVHTLAPIMELFPEIHLCFEDENWKQGVWNWVLMGRRIYLVEPALQRMWYADSLLTLLGVFLNGSISSRTETGGEGRR
jgi:hypothetical protein